MWSADSVLRVLRARGEIWQATPGLVGLRGDVLRLQRAIERQLSRFATAETDDEWCVPAGIALETLERADYFDSFPHWLTVAAHLSDDASQLERVARATSPSSAARSAVAPAKAALAPAVCYHVYSALAGSIVTSQRIVTAQGICWRHEGERHSPLERGWAFTMREVVCIGTQAEVAAFLERAERRVLEIASELQVEADVVPATDPFFAPTGRGKSLLQQVKGLKREVAFPLDATRTVAAASLNNHETFFGKTFAIRLPAGESAATGCVAFGLERWTLAFLCAHGPDAARWPSVSGANAVHAEALK